MTDLANVNFRAYVAGQSLMVEADHDGRLGRAGIESDDPRAILDQWAAWLPYVTRKTSRPPFAPPPNGIMTVVIEAYFQVINPERKSTCSV